MTTKITILISLLSFKLISQTITYSNFNAALTNTTSANIATNSSFNSTLTTVIGNGVTWDASGLTIQAGTPVVHFSFENPSSTPQGTLFPSSNYVEYDPALTSIVSYNYYLYNSDSITSIGSYDPSAAHEIFQNPDKHLIFPFAYGQSFTDNYSKTNYSNATTVSSYQTGTRTVSFNGFGTLILPQATFNNVALISESRTNSLGPISHEYTWYDISNGRKLLYRSENNGSIITVWSSGITLGLEEKNLTNSVVIYPNPIKDISTLKIHSETPLNNAVLKIYNIMGIEIKSIPVKNQEVIIDKEGTETGIYFYNLLDCNRVLNKGELIIQ